MKLIVLGLIVVLAIAHQDFWNWNDPKLIFDFLPIGLAYHAVYSVLCGVVWALAVKFAWPSDTDV